MIKKKQLTNEKLKAKFSNQFDLVNNAIHYAREIIRNGKSEIMDRNVALMAIQELNGEDEED